MTHTPGPWEFEECYKHNGYTHHIRTDEVGGFALVDGFENANLIAAAPDLLAAAKDAVFWMPGGAEDSICHYKLRSREECQTCQRKAALVAAVAKAEGND